MAKTWPSVDKDFLNEFLKINNYVALKRKTQKEFNDFVLTNVTKFDNPDYLQIFIENADVTNSEGFFEENFEMCKVFYDFLIKNPEWSSLGFSLRTFMRIGVFQESFEEYLKSNK